MKQKRHETDEVVQRLPEAEMLEGQGQAIAQVCQRLEIREQTCTAGEAVPEDGGRPDQATQGA